MSQVDRPRRRVLGPLASLGVWLVFALIAWLDSDSCAWALRPGLELHTAAVFGVIWAALQTVAGFIGTAAQATAAYLATVVSWLAGRVADILHSSGAMFARIWDGVKIVWSDVLRPALRWLDTQLTKLHEWLKTTFKPVFDWLKRVRDELQHIYAKFVRPVIDTIEFIRELNRVLQVFGITVLQAIDRTLQQLEQRIEEPFLWLYQELHSLWYWMDRVVDLDGYYQRLTLFRSMSKYAPDWINHFWKRQVGTPKPTNGTGGGGDEALDVDPASYGKMLGDVLQGKDTSITAYVGELVPLWSEAAGLMTDSKP